MKDNIINVNFTARHKKKLKFANYIKAKLKKLRIKFTFKGKSHNGSSVYKNYHKNSM